MFAIEDYEAKYYTLLRLAAGQDISCIATVNPSTVLLLGDRLAKHTEPIIRDVRDGSLSYQFSVPQDLRDSLHLRPDPERARHLERAAAAGGGLLRPGLAWPNWPRSAAGRWDRRRLPGEVRHPLPAGTTGQGLRLLPTELRGSVPLSDQGDAGVTAVGTNVVEFHPADDDRAPEGRHLLTVDQLEVGRRYFVYVTNASGLYRYDMNDIVEVAGHYGQTPLIRFIQRGKAWSRSPARSSTRSRSSPPSTRRWPGCGPLPLHRRRRRAGRGTTPRLVFLVEFDDPVAEHDGSALVDRLDAALGGQNDEYQTKRKSLRYGPPIIRVVRSGEYDRYRRHMVETGQRADGQFKILRLTSDTSFAAEFDAEQDLVGSERTSA